MYQLGIINYICQLVVPPRVFLTDHDAETRSGEEKKANLSPKSTRPRSYILLASDKCQTTRGNGCLFRIVSLHTQRSRVIKWIDVNDLVLWTTYSADSLAHY